MLVHGGMSIGPSYDHRDTIRRWAGVSENAICRLSGVTPATLRSWEHGHEAWVAGRFRNELDREQVVARLADVYAGLMWMVGGWPRHLDDEPLRAAVERMRTAVVPYAAGASS